MRYASAIGNNYQPFTISVNTQDIKSAVTIIISIYSMWHTPILEWLTILHSRFDTIGVCGHTRYKPLNIVLKCPSVTFYYMTNNTVALVKSAYPLGSTPKTSSLFAASIQRDWVWQKKKLGRVVSPVNEAENLKCNLLQVAFHFQPGCCLTQCGSDGLYRIFHIPYRCRCKLDLTNYRIRVQI